eukprot:g68183.t1
MRPPKSMRVVTSSNLYVTSYSCLSATPYHLLILNLCKTKRTLNESLAKKFAKTRTNLCSLESPKVLQPRLCSWHDACEVCEGIFPKEKKKFQKSPPRWIQKQPRDQQSFSISDKAASFWM